MLFLFIRSLCLDEMATADNFKTNMSFFPVLFWVFCHIACSRITPNVNLTGK